MHFDGVVRGNPIMRGVSEQRIQRSLWFCLVFSASLLWGHAGHARADLSSPRRVERRVLPRDQLRVVFDQDPTLSGLYPVLGNGSIEFGYAGSVHVADRTPSGAADHLKQVLLATYFREVSVDVTTSHFAEGAITLMGAVRNEGQIPFESRTMMTLIEAIAQAGGLSRNANASEIRILRMPLDGGMQRDVITVDLSSMFTDFDTRADEFLRPRDIIFVPALGSGDESREFLMLGEVGRVGFHPWSENMDMIRAVALAGGYARHAQLDSVRILRPQEGGGHVAIPVDMNTLIAGRMEENRRIFPGDIVVFPSTENARAGQVHLMGAVASPGTVDLPLNQSITLARLIFARGGASEFGNLRRVRLIRTAPDGSKQTLHYDVEEILRNGLFEQDIPLQDQDVIMVQERGILGF